MKKPHMSDDLDDIKAEVSQQTGVPRDVLRGTNRDEITEHANAVKPLLAPPGPAAGYVPTQGRTMNRPAVNPSQAFADFINQQLGHTR